MFSKPTLARSTSKISSATTAPITANWNRCCALQPALAPKSSIKVDPPTRSGTADIIAGRSTPGNIFKT